MPMMVHPTPPELPPIEKWFKSPTAEGSVEYNVGDTKEYNGKTWHYYDAPNHRRRIKRHTHATFECRTCTSWLATEEGASATANIAPVTDISDDAASTAESVVSTDSSMTTNFLVLCSSVRLLLGGDLKRGLLSLMFLDLSFWFTFIVLYPDLL